MPLNLRPTGCVCPVYLLQSLTPLIIINHRLTVLSASSVIFAKTVLLLLFYSLSKDLPLSRVSPASLPPCTRLQPCSAPPTSSRQRTTHIRFHFLPLSTPNLLHAPLSPRLACVRSTARAAAAKARSLPPPSHPYRPAPAASARLAPPLGSRARE